MTEASLQALSLLRQPERMQWYVIPFLAAVAYFYLNEAEQGNWSAVWLGIATWAAELIWEMCNGLVLHFSNYAPLWSTPGPTAFLIYAGLNIEITLFFAVCALLLIKLLPKDRTLKILGLSNRVFIPVAGGLVAVFAEVLLNRCGLLIWDWKFWGWPHLYLIVVAYCAPALFLAWAHDHTPLRKQRNAAFYLLAAAAVCHLVFATLLGWV